MSRGRYASIFIDNGLSSIIKPSVEDDYTANAPSLTDKVNGTSIIDDLRKEKLEILSKMDLSDVSTNQESGNSQSSTNQEPENNQSPTDFKAPETIVNPEEEAVE